MKVIFQIENSFFHFEDYLRKSFKMKNRKVTDYTIRKDRFHIEISYSTFKNIYRDFNRFQASQSRNVKLTIGFGLVSSINNFINFLKSYFPKVFISDKVLDFGYVLALVSLIFFVYLFFTSKKETSEPLEDIKEDFENHKNSVKSHLIEDFDNTPTPTHPPSSPVDESPDSREIPKLRIESG